MLPASVRESGGIVTVLIAILLAGTLRSAFIKPLFLIMMMVRFHALAENQPINQDWDDRLASVSDKFGTLGAGFALSPRRMGLWGTAPDHRLKGRERRRTVPCSQEEPMAVAAEPAPQDNSAQIAYWNDRAAVTWTTLQEHLDGMFAPLTARAIDAAAPSPGNRVLDVGCGCGATVLALAGRVGPNGQVLGVDVSGPMAARARERIAAAGMGNANVVVSDASTHRFDPESVDLLFSRFGVMFFADPTAAFANLRRAIRPGGRLLFAAWRPMAENPWFVVPFKAAEHLLPPQPPAEPNAPGPFALADPDRVKRILSAAGWTDISLARQDVPVRLSGPGQIAEAAEFATRVGGLARALVEASPEVKQQAIDAIAKALPGHDSPDGVCLTGSVWFVSAKN